MHNIQTAVIEISKLKPNHDNPRTIKDDNFKKLVKSLQDFPEMIEAREIVVNKDLVILGGNMRYQAAKEAGIKELPVKIVDWTEEKQREFIIKDNVSGGDWDWEALANEWSDINLGDWGLELPVILSDEEIIEDEPPKLESEQPACSQSGKVYILGEHLLYCGSFEEVDALFNKPATACVTDPPYGIGYIGGSKCRRERIANDNMSDDDFRIFLDKISQSIARNVQGGGNGFYVTN